MSTEVDQVTDALCRNQLTWRASELLMDWAYQKQEGEDPQPTVTVPDEGISLRLTEDHTTEAGDRIITADCGGGGFEVTVSVVFRKGVHPLAEPIWDGQLIIRLQCENTATRWPCCVCGGHTEKHDVYAVAFREDGQELGHVCEGCIASGREGMRQAAHDRCDALMVGKLRFAIVPTTADWDVANKKFGAFFAGKTDDCDLPDVHTPLVLPDGREVPVILRK